MERSGAEWSGVEWSGVEWNGVEEGGVEGEEEVEWKERRRVEWKERTEGGGERIFFAPLSCRCHGNNLLNWYFAPNPDSRLVTMATSYFLSSDWSSGLVHNMNDICIRDLLF